MQPLSLFLSRSFSQVVCLRLRQQEQLRRVEMPFSAASLHRSLARCNSFVLSFHCCTEIGDRGGKRSSSPAAPPGRKNGERKRKRERLHSDGLIVGEKFFVPPLFRVHAASPSFLSPLCTLDQATGLFICTVQMKSCGKFRLHDFRLARDMEAPLVIIAAHFLTCFPHNCVTSHPLS